METLELLNDNHPDREVKGDGSSKLEFFSALLKLLRDEVLYKGLLYSIQRENYEMVALYRNELQQRGRLQPPHEDLNSIKEDKDM